MIHYIIEGVLLLFILVSHRVSGSDIAYLDAWLEKIDPDHEHRP